LIAASKFKDRQVRQIVAANNGLAYNSPYVKARASLQKGEVLADFTYTFFDKHLAEYKNAEMIWTRYSA